MKRLLIAAAAVVLLAMPALAQTSSQSTTRPGATSPQASPRVENKAGQSQGKIDLNTASKEELDSLRGIGEKRADAIIKGRPYKSVEDLQSKKIVPSNVYAEIKDKVTVGPGGISPSAGSAASSQAGSAGATSRSGQGGTSSGATTGGSSATGTTTGSGPATPRQPR